MENLEKFYINASRETAIPQLANTLADFLSAELKNDQPIIVLCIGTDRATGDSFGPLVGHKLMENKRLLGKIFVYGTLDVPVHAKNIEKTIANIYKTFKNPFIIAVDASLGNFEKIGHISVGKGQVAPGVAQRKHLPKIGDVYIMGVVENAFSLDMFVLQNTRLSVVMKMADATSEGITSAILCKGACTI